MIEFVEPDVKYHVSYLDMLKKGGQMALHGASIEDPDLTQLEDADAFDRLCDYLRQLKEPNGARPSGHVPCTQLWIVEEGQAIGNINIRHGLTEWLCMLLNFGIRLFQPFFVRVFGFLGAPAARRRVSVVSTVWKGYRARG